MLLAEGYHVIATYAHDVEAASASAKVLAQTSSHFDIVKCDQADAHDVAHFAQTIKTKYTHIDCLVCNAGTTLRKDLTEMTNEEWERVMMVNVNSNVYLIRDLFECFESSRIVLIGSLMALHPHGTSLAYGVTKSAVHALAKNLVKHFEGRDVTINAIAPGFVETEWQRTKPVEIRQNICNKTALRRFASVEEVADAVRFCISNTYINGSVLELSGGYSYK